MREPSTSSPDAAAPRPAGPAPEHLKALAEAPTAMLSDALGHWGNIDAAIRPVAAGMQKALAAGQTTVDILGLRAKLPQ